jgi:hypothetical protein
MKNQTPTKSAQMRRVFGGCDTHRAESVSSDGHGGERQHFAVTGDAMPRPAVEGRGPGGEGPGKLAWFWFRSAGSHAVRA